MTVKTSQRQVSGLILTAVATILATDVELE